LDEDFSFYDCMDHFTLLPDKRANPLVLAAMERKLVKKADLIFVTSKALQDRKETNRGEWVLVRNGVDLNHFDPHVSRFVEPDGELAGITKPIIGYIGCIDSWFDGDAIAFLAASRPDLSLVLVGPVQDRATARKLRGYRNVHLLGPKPYRDLPRYLDAFAVCLIPFQVNELTRAVNPVKLYEYLAAGKPVVAAPLDEIRRYRDLVSIYATKEELVEEVDRALREQDPEIARLRVQVAGENTWGRRVEEMGRALASYLAPEANARPSS
jgi:glycosyltransferase involved in cell wall biosynthesis